MLGCALCNSIVTRVPWLLLQIPKFLGGEMTEDGDESSSAEPLSGEPQTLLSGERTVVLQVQVTQLLMFQIHTELSHVAHNGCVCYRAAWSMLSPFLDPVVSAKIQILKGMLCAFVSPLQ